MISFTGILWFLRCWYFCKFALHIKDLVASWWQKLAADLSLIIIYYSDIVLLDSFGNTTRPSMETRSVIMRKWANGQVGKWASGQMGIWTRGQVELYWLSCKIESFWTSDFVLGASTLIMLKRLLLNTHRLHLSILIFTPRNPYWIGRISTVDLLVLANSDQVLFILTLYFSFLQNILS